MPKLFSSDEVEEKQRRDRFLSHVRELGVTVESWTKWQTFGLGMMQNIIEGTILIEHDDYDDYDRSGPWRRRGFLAS